MHMTRLTWQLSLLLGRSLLCHCEKYIAFKMFNCTCGVCLCESFCKTVVIVCRAEDKLASLLYLVQEVIPASQQTIIFAATRHHVEFLHMLLEKEGIESACVYGTMDQASEVPDVNILLTSIAAPRIKDRRSIFRP